MYRTHTCGELRRADVGKTVQLAGWVHKVRTHGSLTFLDVRDRYGLTQVTLAADLGEKASSLRKESVVSIEGTVTAKPEANKALATGEIEVAATNFSVLNESDVIPISLDDDANTSDEMRLKYRYLDLRKSTMKDNLVFRHELAQAFREALNREHFLEIETPLLIRSTPEGARDFLVPSRLNKGHFYSLPQSPQLYKQLLMVSGMDRYYQLAKCLRDEDLRADRQPEFTQIDLEMSFVQADDVMSLLERVMTHVLKTTKQIDLATPLRRISYAESMEKYGIDRPDLRFGLELVDVTELLKKTDMNVFKEAPMIKALVAPKVFSRKEIDALTDVVKVYGAKGLAYATFQEGTFTGGVSKFLEPIVSDLQRATAVENGQTIFFVADTWKTTNDALAHLRLHLGKELGLIDPRQLSFCWVVDFPLFEWDEEEKRFSPMHHIFSMPQEKTMQYIETEPARVLGDLYDLVLNGTELGGGGIRIHRQDIQERVLAVIGMDSSAAQNKFGFLLESFKYGAPPHGGFAFGFDRVAALLSGQEDIRDFIAFPKNKQMQSPLDDSPNAVEKDQLDELHINVQK
ncbi:MAG: aspartate--tRNA ligase [Candidatus Woesearchaeota archaeon]|nr:MAG: aspartate--tRNA ligase [Candidatus Woesearchaeota archaeon]